MTNKRMAEEANYFGTTVHPAKSMAEIVERLEDFGVTNRVVSEGHAGGRVAWLVRFEWREETYRFTFTPLPCKLPDKEAKFGDKRRTHEQQARYQMGRVATYFVKAVLTAAEMHPDALFGFIELPGAGTHPSGLPITAAELNIDGFTALLPAIDSYTALLESGKESDASAAAGWEVKQQ